LPHCFPSSFSFALLRLAFEGWIITVGRTYRFGLDLVRGRVWVNDIVERAVEKEGGTVRDVCGDENGNWVGP
jgi:hypothetical protein